MNFVEALCAVMVPAQPNTYSVRQFSDHASYYAGRNAEGFATLLIKASGSGRVIPMRLAGIEAFYAMACHIAEMGEDERVERLCVIICTSTNPTIETYFSVISDVFVSMLGPNPSAKSVESAVEHIVELFQKLRKVPTRPLLGLVGELLVIFMARDSDAALSGWRNDPDERYDFASCNLRLEAKSTGGRLRIHTLSFAQANPPQGTVGLLASLLIENSAGGTPLGELMAKIDRKIACDAAKIKLRTVVGDTLGQDLPAALGWSFDMQQATSSLKIFDMRSIPAIRGSLPPGVLNVTFVANVEGCPLPDWAELSSIEQSALGLLPSDRGVP